MSLDVQKVFNKVIACGLYGTTRFMCAALSKARESNIINQEEHEIAQKAIFDYLTPKGYFTLWDAINDLGEIIDDKTLKSLYLNWHNRPELKHKEL